MLAIYIHRAQATLTQVHVADKTNEVFMAQTLVGHLALRGRVLMADALHTWVALVAAVMAQGGDVVSTVKANQPTMYADLVTYFADPAAWCLQAETLDRQRGRVERPVRRVSTEPSSYLSTDSRWPDVAQVGQPTRTVATQCGRTVQVVYALTMLAPTHACPQCWLQLLRDLWHIENGLLYMHDVPFGEDCSCLRTGHAPQRIAALRHVALTPIHRTGTRAVAAAHRHFRYHPDHAWALLISPVASR